MLAAAGWGLFAGAALVIGAAVAWFIPVPPKVVGSVMAFGSGVLISAVAFELFDEAARTGGLGPAVFGFGVGAAVYMLANLALARFGARHRKRSQHQQPTREQQSGSGLAIALGALLDGIPESLVLGISLLGGGGVSTAVVAAVFISNLPEGLSSAAGMKNAGRGARYVFGVWGAIAIVSAASAAVGYLLLGSAPVQVIAAITAIAGGAILTMIADTMIPEAFEITHAWTGLITSAGFLLAAAISWFGG
ncbi:ZIP family zinc transporter [Tessaracoccus sp. MC1865]|uniref:ZIP family metal transporter n=1 Tax=Tessaracoccus sp. MC1865 TaxID=2760310 RepID=UPI0016029EFC|nr:ZIP family zinc transporter [Tessaracoccus sp. MC1865]MBB1483081.1 ZIP family zinc transporter [Tessaracoccus sp. MC1865]